MAKFLIKKNRVEIVVVKKKRGGGRKEVES